MEPLLVIELARHKQHLLAGLMAQILLKSLPTATASFQKLGVNYNSALNLPLTVGGSGEVAAFTDSKGAAININLGNTTGVSEIASNGSTSKLELTCNSNKNITLNNDGTTAFGGKVTSPSTTSADGGTTLATKDYVDTHSGGGGGFYAGAAAWGCVDNAGVLKNGLNCSIKTTLNTGQYEVVFTSPMPSDNYSVEAVVDTPSGAPVGDVISTFDRTANGFKIGILTGKDNLAVPGAFSFAVHATNALPPRGGTGSDAWADIESSGNILASFNIASVVRNETGRYQVTFTHPMPTANYAINSSIMAAAPGSTYPANITTSGFLLCVDNATGSGAQDLDFAVSVHATMRSCLTR